MKKFILINSEIIKTMYKQYFLMFALIVFGFAVGLKRGLHYDETIGYFLSNYTFWEFFFLYGIIPFSVTGLFVLHHHIRCYLFVKDNVWYSN